MKGYIVGAALVFGAIAFGAAAEAASFRSYSADMEMTSAQGVHTSKVYATNTKQRMESKADGRSMIMITRFDKKVAWMCMPEQKTCMETPLNPQKQDIQSQMNDPEAKVDKQFLGNETVDSHPSKKYHIVITRNGKRESSGFIWEASDLNGFPVKFQSEDKSSTMTWKNISFSSIPDSLFEMPQGYQKMGMQDMPGMMKRRK